MKRTRGQIITFYSFKGGVGRSMALANVATVLAQRGKRVLALDFDLEAPGLHRYFLREPDLEPPLGKPRFTPEGAQKGIIDLFKELRAGLRAGPQGALQEIVAGLPLAEEYKYRVSLKNPNERSRTCSIDFITAGRFDRRYVDRVRAFGWKRFYAEQAEALPVLADELARGYDYVLIDSRTGFSDVGSLCTMVLPDKLVLVFSPNEQSLAGALDIGEQAVQECIASGRPILPLFPLISRLEDTEEMEKRRWVKRAQESFEALFRDAYGLKACDLDAYFDQARIHHRGYYAYGERIAAEEEKAGTLGSMAESFKAFADCLEQTSALDVRAGSRGAERRADAPTGVLADLLVSALGGQCDLTDSHLDRLSRSTTPELLRRWGSIVASLPKDRGAVAPLVVALWREALHLGLVPAIPALDRRVDRGALARFYLEKKRFWRGVTRRAPSSLGRRARAERARFEWAEGAWDPSQPLAGPLFEVVWDVLHARFDDEKLLDTFELRWWGAAGGSIDARSPVVFPWPLADLPAFSTHEHLAARWNHALGKAGALAAIMPDDDGPADDLAYWYASYHHALWHTNEGSPSWRTGVGAKEWRNLVQHLTASISSAAADDRAYAEWARALPLLAAPESGLSSEAAEAILSAARVDEERRSALRVLRSNRVRVCLPTQAPEQTLAAIDAANADHPWVRLVEG